MTGRYDTSSTEWDRLAYKNPAVEEDAEQAEQAYRAYRKITPKQFCAMVGKRTGIPTNWQSRTGIASRQDPCAYVLPREICTVGSKWHRGHRETLRTLIGAIDCEATRGACFNALNGVVCTEGELPPSVAKIKAKLRGLGIHVPDPQPTPSTVPTEAEGDAFGYSVADDDEDDEEDPFAEVAA